MDYKPFLILALADGRMPFLYLLTGGSPVGLAILEAGVRNTGKDESRNGIHLAAEDVQMKQRFL